MASQMERERPPLAPPRAANPFNDRTSELPAAERPSGGLVSVEAQRAIAEVQARMIMARANPRDPIRAMETILNDCTRPTLAKAAVYSYVRGGTTIEGLTIRIAEAMAQKWGNIASGIKEIARHDGYSECVAYAWDLETGFYDERQFQVKHWRDTKQGGYALKDERDIYELIANMGQRRKRAVLLTVIPGDVAEAAEEQCKRTMLARADTSPEGIKQMIDAFAEYGVTAAQIETRIQRRLDAIRPAQMVTLEKIYNSLRDGVSVAADWFEEATPPPLVEPGPPDPAATATTGRRRRAAAGGGTPEPQQPPQREPPPPGPAEEPPPRDEPHHEDPPPRQEQPAGRQVRFEV